MRYSASLNAFFAAGIDYPELPPDLVQITAEQHRAMLAGQAIGRRIVAGDDGLPVLVDPPTPDPADLLAAWRASTDVAKVALVRAMREVTLAGVAPSPGDLTAWQEVRSAIEMLPEDAREDWHLATRIPRMHTALLAFAAARGLPPEVLDAVFARAQQIEATT